MELYHDRFRGRDLGVVSMGPNPMVDMSIGKKGRPSITAQCELFKRVSYYEEMITKKRRNDEES